MARPQKVESIAAASSAVEGEAVKTKGHHALTLWVEARGLDPQVDTLTINLEGSLFGDNWAQFEYRAPSASNVFQIQISDLEDQGGGTFVGMASSNSFAVDFVRGNIQEFTDDAGDDLEVDVYVINTGWNGPANTFLSRE